MSELSSSVLRPFPIHPRVSSPRAVLSKSSVSVSRPSADHPEPTVRVPVQVRSVPCVRVTVASVLSQLRRVVRGLSFVASPVQQSPREVLHRTLIEAKRAAVVEKSLRLRERLANLVPSRSGKRPQASVAALRQRPSPVASMRSSQSPASRLSSGASRSVPRSADRRCVH